MLSSALQVHFLIVPLLPHVFAQDAHMPPVQPSCTAVHTPDLRTGDAVYIYGSPFPQIHAEALRDSVRFGQVSNVMYGQHHSAEVWSHSQALSSSILPQTELPNRSMMHSEKHPKPTPSLVLLDFKSLPGVHSPPLPEMQPCQQISQSTAVIK